MKTQMNKTQMMRTLLIRCGTIMVVSALLSGCISLPGQSPIQSMAFDKMTDQEREALAQNYDRNPQNRNAALAYPQVSEQPDSTVRPWRFWRN